MMLIKHLILVGLCTTAFASNDDSTSSADHTKIKMKMVNTPDTRIRNPVGITDTGSRPVYDKFGVKWVMSVLGMTPAHPKNKSADKLWIRVPIFKYCKNIHSKSKQFFEWKDRLAKHFDPKDPYESFVYRYLDLTGHTVYIGKAEDYTRMGTHVTGNQRIDRVIQQEPMFRAKEDIQDGKIAPHEIKRVLRDAARKQKTNPVELSCIEFIPLHKFCKVHGDGYDHAGMEQWAMTHYSRRNGNRLPKYNKIDERKPYVNEDHDRYEPSHHKAKNLARLERISSKEVLLGSPERARAEKLAKKLRKKLYKPPPKRKNKYSYDEDFQPPAKKRRTKLPPLHSSNQRRCSKRLRGVSPVRHVAFESGSSSDNRPLF